ncbi:hypothetical protein PCL_01425 [Purpureocillium lilacinum]|uniref:Uncharacterized protein n=1 Tax=Purpureocillium lilacinum TaxID=33203 RepID=A0A2U3E3G0_PURLI|nr:hypothetical protein Purlil1_6518 [Purpureocillium lilacinum]PWI69040.1 hypothetical protein PCL_01425 [Purpureocillium lilacinum]
MKFAVIVFALVAPALATLNVARSCHPKGGKCDPSGTVKNAPILKPSIWQKPAPLGAVREVELGDTGDIEHHGCRLSIAPSFQHVNGTVLRMGLQSLYLEMR